ncbi:hypothetical protein PM032_00565 [Halorubrum ezzemoulense]|uniref:hypothetical protein n=1 Tax=Halorubrum ezzemoulense TaxID=337243 RepID=UPI00232AC682|nr:hypothetical protein [Halorubrum ezzemoulense]MDB2269512.1 hypothetical protein [Halorubrum ezzemoulense]
MDIVRKRFSLTVYHNELLEEIVDQRYASRSEAVRAAIQHHSQYISEGGETDIEAIKANIDRLVDEIGAIDEKLDERNSVVQIADHTPDDSGVSDDSNVTEQSKSESVSKELVVKELSEAGPLEVSELVKRTDLDYLSVIPAVESLQEDGVIQLVNHDGDEYEINT